MRWAVVLFLASPTLLSGCNVAYYAAHNLVNEPAQTINQHKLRHRMRAEAQAAWQAECARNPGAFSPAYADGFVDGYADHLNNGGPPAPPGAPPPQYRRHANDFTPTGQAAQLDYMAGFKHGAEAACAAGGRQGVVVPILLPQPQPELPLNITCIPASPESLLFPPAGPPMFPPVRPPGAAVPLPLPAPQPAPVPKSVPPAAAPKPGVGPLLRKSLLSPGLPTPVRAAGATGRPAPVVSVDRADPSLPPPRLLPPEREVAAASLTAPVTPVRGAEWARAKRWSELATEIGLPPVSSPP